MAEINNEAKACRSTKLRKLGEARVISYKGLEKARAERAAKEAAKEAKKAKKEAKKAAKEVEEATTGKKKLRWSKITQRKSPEKSGTPEPKAKLARMSEAQAEVENAPEPWRALVARMW